jgi:hypothetical protein
MHGFARSPGLGGFSGLDLAAVGRPPQPLAFRVLRWLPHHLPAGGVANCAGLERTCGFAWVGAGARRSGKMRDDNGTQNRLSETSSGPLYNIVFGALIVFCPTQPVLPHADDIAPRS